jgi:phage repressor protein C with HTH and peptisase S24 domain
MADKTIGDRLQLLMKTLRYKQYEFSQRYGLSHSTIVRYKQNDRRPDTDFLIQLARDGVNANWLLTGEGEMFNEDATFAFGPRLKQKNLELIHPWKGKVTPQEQVNTRVIVLPIEGQIAAGLPQPIDSDFDNTKYVEIPRVYLHGSPDNHLVFVVNGRSMEPHISHGDIIVIRPEFDWLTVENKVCAVRNEDGITLKKVVFDRKKKHVILQPFNLEFTPLFLDSEHDTAIALIGPMVLQFRLY